MIAPEITYWSGRGYPFELWTGDVIFIAGTPPAYKIGTFGVPPVAEEDKFAFEHVAIATEDRVVNNDKELADTKIIGLPEIDLRWGQTHYEKWVEKIISRLVLGVASPRRLSDWIPHLNRFKKYGQKAPGEPSGGVANLVGRVYSDKSSGISCVNQARRSAAKAGIRYRSGPPQFPDGKSAWTNNNCVGFVYAAFLACSVSVKIVEEDFPVYDNHYRVTDHDGPERHWPSPGHIARALRLGNDGIPYRPQDRAEANKYALACKTLEEQSTAGIE